MDRGPAMIRLAIVSVGLVLVTGHASAEPLDADSVHTVNANVHFGVATAPFDVMTLPEAKGQALTFLAGGRTLLAPEVVFEIRVPIVLASVAQPAGSYVDRAAIGNPQLGGSYRWILPRLGGQELAVSAGVDLGVPIATHDAALMSNRALAIANGVDGLARPELFTPGTLPITSFADLRWASRQWGLQVRARVPLLVRTSDADLPPSTARTHAVGVAGVLVVEGWRRISRRVALASAAQLFVDAVPSAEHVRSVSRVQDLERMSLHVVIGARATLMVDLQTALGGELGGSMFGLGLRTVVELP
jgi:hypothetical protein